MRERIELAVKKAAAIADLIRRGLVLRRSAAHYGGDVCIAQGEPVFFVRGRGLRGEAGAVQHAIEKMTGAIAGERAAGAVGAMRARRQAEDQHPRVHIAEARHRLGPIVAVAVGAALLTPDLLAIFDQPQTAGAGDEFAIKLDKSSGGHSCYFLTWHLIRENPRNPWLWFCCLTAFTRSLKIKVCLCSCAPRRKCR